MAQINIYRTHLKHLILWCILRNFFPVGLQLEILPCFGWEKITFLFLQCLTVEWNIVGSGNFSSVEYTCY